MSDAIFSADDDTVEIELLQSHERIMWTVLDVLEDPKTNILSAKQ